MDKGGNNTHSIMFLSDALVTVFETRLCDSFRPIFNQRHEFETLFCRGHQSRSFVHSPARRQGLTVGVPEQQDCGQSVLDSGGEGIRGKSREGSRVNNPSSESGS